MKRVEVFKQIFNLSNSSVDYKNLKNHTYIRNAFQHSRGYIERQDIVLKSDGKEMKFEKKTNIEMKQEFVTHLFKTITNISEKFSKIEG